jgi:NRAMP (natural resistance-associated macrophage protein)-like metal ion transporter
VALLLWITAEISIVACDVQGIIATAIAIKILFGFPLWLGALFTGFDLVTFMLIDFAEVGSHQIEWLFVSLVTMMAVCFFWNFSVNPPSSYRACPPLPSLSLPWLSSLVAILFGTFVPTMDSSQNINLAVGLIGFVILPQNFFMHRYLPPPLRGRDLLPIVPWSWRTDSRGAIPMRSPLPSQLPSMTLSLH